MIAWHFRPAPLGHRAGSREQGEMDSVCQPRPTTFSIMTLADTLGLGLGTSNRVKPAKPSQECPRANFYSSTL